MFNAVEHVLYQILIILFPILPIFIFHMFFNDLNNKHKQTTTMNLTAIFMVMLLLTMSFPVIFSETYRYDFRVIPVILAFAYCGIFPGILVVFALLLYRYFIGGDGFYLTLVNYVLATAIIFYIMKKYEQMRLNRKIILVNIAFGVIVASKAAALVVYNQLDQLEFMLIFYTITWICLLIVVVFIENVTQKITMQREMQRADKLNVISQLAASVAHEVRNPMTTVRGFLQIIKSDGNLDIKHKNFIDIALGELDHAQSIINDYLSLAKPQNQELTCVNISSEVKKTVELMTSYSNIQNIRITTSIQDSLYIKGNKDEIKQVLVNIIKNGIEAMDNRGSLSINVFEKEGIIYIEIIDSGIGMTKKHLENLGKPFYSTKEKGTGVGLTLSYQLVQSMRGKIKVKSDPGIGTNFTIEFPGIQPAKTEL